MYVAMIGHYYTRINRLTAINWEGMGTGNFL